MRPIQGQRANVTTPTPQWPSTWPIQGQRDCHIRYVDLQYIISFYETYPGPIRQHSMTSTFNDLLRDIRHCHLQYANIQWASTRPIQAQRDCHIRYVHLQYIHEVYQGPTWLGQPKYDPPTLHWVYTRYIQGQRDCHVRNADLQYILEVYPDTDVTAICHIRCANTSMSF